MKNSKRMPRRRATEASRRGVHIPSSRVWLVVTVAAVDVEHAADLYARGWTLRRIAAELGLTETTVSDQLRRAG